MTEHLHIATIASPHGLKGQFKLNCLLESPASLKKISGFYDQHGAPIKLQLISIKAKQPIAAMADIHDRDAAERLKHTKLFAQATDFPPANEDEYYGHQLAGLDVIDDHGTCIGRVLAHHYYGAGDILEIQWQSGQKELLPFDEPTFPELDEAKRTIRYAAPDWIE